MQKETYEEYRSLIKDLGERVKRLDKRIEEVAESPRYQKRVAILRAFKGIGYIIALSLICEVGDFRRFRNASSFMSYLGIVPGENSSGGKRRQGKITKAGNGHLRRLLVESAWHYAMSNRVSRDLEERRSRCPAAVVEKADKALKRLHWKYVRMVLKNGKHKNVAITAVSRELAGFVWAVMTSA
jgi:transposase